MTGFKLTWSIQSDHPLPSSPMIMESKQNKDLQRMIRVAATKRTFNKSRHDIIKEAVDKKEDHLMIRNSQGKVDGMNYKLCKSDEKMVYINFDDFSEVLISDQSKNISSIDIMQEDIKIGFALYMIAVHCSKETTKLAQFLLQLVKEESLPKILLAIINTLQSDDLTMSHRILLGRIYNVLEDLFGLHLGKVLLATSSPVQLAAFQNQYLPFLNYSDEHVQQCISRHSCNDVFGSIQGIFI